MPEVLRLRSSAVTEPVCVSPRDVTAFEALIAPSFSTDDSVPDLSITPLAVALSPTAAETMAPVTTSELTVEPCSNCIAVAVTFLVDALIEAEIDPPTWKSGTLAPEYKRMAVALAL